MSDKCPGCGYYTLACQCKKDDNYCRDCGRIISDCRCNHHDHYRYGESSDNHGNCRGDNACFIY